VCLAGISTLLLLHFLPSIYSYFGQAFVACVPTVPTAQILAAVFIGLNNFFSGLIVRPQYLSGFFEIPYWITPGKPRLLDSVTIIALYISTLSSN